jgi:hypothetical protein
MGVAPEAIVEKDFFEYRLKVQFFFLLLTSTVWKPPSPSQGFHIVIPQSPLLLLLFFLIGVIVYCVQNLTPIVKYVYGPCFSTGAR